MLLFATIKISKFKEYIRYVKGFSLIHLLKKTCHLPGAWKWWLLVMGIWKFIVIVSPLYVWKFYNIFLKAKGNLGESDFSCPKHNKLEICTYLLYKYYIKFLLQSKQKRQTNKKTNAVLGEW